MTHPTGLQRYDAFISYGHGTRQGLVDDLHTRLERFGKPWYRARSLRVFRDRTAMAAGTDLWGAIVEAMTMSSWLVVVASPESATSEWVNREIEWWLRHKDARTVLVVLVAGELRWSGAGWHRAVSPSLPPALDRAFTAEPFWVDLRSAPGTDTVDPARLDDAVASIAAAIEGVPKDRLIGRHLDQQRRTRRHLGVGGAVGIVLLIGVLVATLLAGQRGRSASAGRLAALSGSVLATDVALGRLLAVEAVRADPTPQTTAALFRAVTAVPALTGYLPAGAPVTALAAASTAPVVVAGTAAGEVQRWEGGRRTTIWQADGPVTAVATSADGSVVAAASASRTATWSGRGVDEIPVPAGREPGPTAVSPSGRIAWFQLNTAGVGAEQGRTVPTELVTVDTASAARRSNPVTGAWSQATAADDQHVALKADDGRWERRSGRGAIVDVRGSVSLGVHYQVSALSPNGLAFAWTNDGPDIPIYVTRAGEMDTDAPDATLQAPGNNREAVAISPDLRRVAVADAGTVHVIPTGSGSTDDAMTLTGNERLTLLQFAGTSRLVGATGDQVVTWDLNGRGPIVESYGDASIEVPVPCNACAAVSVVSRPDGRAFAMTTATPDVLVVEPGPQGIHGVAFQDLDITYPGAAWTADGERLVLRRQAFIASGDTAQAEVRDGVDAARTVGLWPGLTADPADGAVHALGPGPDGTIAEVDTTGAVRLRDPVTGTVRRTVAGPPDVPRDESAVEFKVAAVSPTGRSVAFLAAGMLWVLDLDSGDTRRVSGDVEQVTASPTGFLVRRVGGTLETWSDDGSQLRRTVTTSTAYAEDSPPAGTETVLAQVTADARVELLDAATGTAIGAVPLPTGTWAEKMGITFTPDGTALVLAAPGSPGLVERWDVTPEGWIAAACRTAGRDLTPDEWQRVVGTRPPTDLACLR